MNFTDFRAALQQRVAQLSAKGTLITLDIDRDLLWQTYLNAYVNPPIFKTRADHDCSCCRAFIKNFGAVGVVGDNGFESIWTFQIDDQQYQRVADVMAGYIAHAPVTRVDPFLWEAASIGVDKNRAEIDGVVHTFNHFHIPKLPAKAVVPRRNIDTKKGMIRTSAELLEKALTQLKPEVTDEVLELIASNSLYRGEEFKTALLGLQKLQREFKASGMPAMWFAWKHIDSPFSRLKNTAIGTLLEDLSAGEDIERAVKSFESKVAPTNYKRPTALVTPRMIEDARKAVEGLGLLDSVHRRYATLQDVSVNNVLFADRSAKKRMKGADAFADLAAAQPVNPKSFDRVDTIDMQKFVDEVLPTATSLEVLFENKHVGNLVSLVTEAVPDSARMFKWDNPFSWSYSGDLADSIKARVKAAGGNVEGDVCCRLAWNNYDDLDLHMVEPQGSGHIYYGTRSAASRNGGRLDVDANAGGGAPGRGTREPVENIFYASADTMRNGRYRLYVNQFRMVESKDNTFTVEIDIRGDVYTFEGQNPRSGSVDIAEIVKTGDTFEVKSTLPASNSARTRTEWGIATGQFQRVTAMMYSPNHWDGQGVGNRHFLFFLADCVNDGNARGFYNEFLRGELEPHRKVLEMIGSRQRTDETPNQLSGLGFSSTKKDTVVVRVTGAVSRILKVTI